MKLHFFQILEKASKKIELHGIREQIRNGKVQKKKNDLSFRAINDQFIHLMINSTK